MQISMKGKYGLKVMVLLAILLAKNQVPLYVIADKISISYNYLENIVSVLRKAGFIKGTKGLHGGYSLTIDPHDVTVGAILNALEGNLIFGKTYDEQKEKIKNTAAYCINICVWNKLNESIQQTVDSITLADLVERG